MKSYSEKLFLGIKSTGYSTVFPQPIQLAATFNVQLAHDVGAAIADEGIQ